jgi:hypothetical protein
MTFTSAILPVPGLIEQNKQLARAKQKQATWYCLAMLGPREPNSQGIAAVKWFEQVVLKRGHPRKKLTYLHDKRTNAEQYLSLQPFPNLDVSKASGTTDTLTGLSVVIVRRSLIATCLGAFALPAFVPI